MATFELKRRPLLERAKLFGLGDEVAALIAAAKVSSAIEQMRTLGWYVAVHNDYAIMGRRKTFWLFTHPDTEKFVKGEGETDAVALEVALSAAGIQIEGEGK